MNFYRSYSGVTVAKKQRSGVAKTLKMSGGQNTVMKNTIFSLFLFVFVSMFGFSSLAYAGGGDDTACNKPVVKKKIRRASCCGVVYKMNSAVTQVRADIKDIKQALDGKADAAAVQGNFDRANKRLDDHDARLDAQKSIDARQDLLIGSLSNWTAGIWILVTLLLLIGAMILFLRAWRENRNHNNVVAVVPPPAAQPVYAATPVPPVAPVYPAPYYGQPYYGVPLGGGININVNSPGEVNYVDDMSETSIHYFPPNQRNEQDRGNRQNRPQRPNQPNQSVSQDSPQTQPVPPANSI